MLTLRDCSRWMFFVTLVVAPWAYGGTTSQSILVINLLLGASLLLCLIDLAIRRRKPKFPMLLLLLIAALLVIGSWMVINARSIYDPEFGTFSSLNNFAPHAPGSFDYTISLAWMIRATLLFGAILLVADLSQDGKGLLHLWGVIAIGGGSISLLGLLQKASGAEAIFWHTPISGFGTGTSFFATYYYHGNAGAFLNLVLPLTAGLAVRAFGTPSGPIIRSLGLTIFLLNLAAVAANTSRGAQLIAGLILLALLWQLGPHIFRRLSRSEKNVALVGVGAILLLLYAIGTASHLEQPISRWKQSEDLSQDTRLLATRVALHALPDVGLLGFGPGTFRAVFPFLNRDQLASGSWRFLHEDYLQTAIEWGWAGSAIWMLLFFGGITAAILSLRKREAREWSWRRRLTLPLVVIALAGVALHALIDFPLQIESIQLYTAVYLGLCWGSARWNSAR